MNSFTTNVEILIHKLYRIYFLKKNTFPTMFKYVDDKRWITVSFALRTNTTTTDSGIVSTYTCPFIAPSPSPIHITTHILILNEANPNIDGIKHTKYAHIFIMNSSLFDLQKIHTHYALDYHVYVNGMYFLKYINRDLKQTILYNPD